MNVDSNYQIKLIGYCSVGKETLFERFIQNGPSSLTNLKGQYVIVIENRRECYIITSLYGVCQYYYTIENNELFHDDTVLGVVRKSRLSWSWNWKALADLTQLDHVLENDTLHPQIYRVPAASILHFKDGVLKTSSLTWEELNPSFPSDPEMALAALNDATKQWLNDNVVLSMSGGFDSRLILSSLLRHHCRPLILTIGFDDSTDIIVSRRIASALGLNLLVVTLDFEDYLEHGRTVTALTNGTQMAEHWHAYLYTKKANLGPDDILFVGSNGEFARSFYIDRGIIALAANKISQLSLWHFWKKSLKLVFKQEELKSLHPKFSSEFTRDGQYARIIRIIKSCNNELLAGLDRFYLEQRERNFFGNFFRLFSENVSWRAPFLNKDWITAIWNMKRSWKLGSNWHRFAIGKNYPQLLDFPEPGMADRIYSKAPLLYWHSFRKKYPIIHYTKCPEWFQNDMVIEFILENAPKISELIETNTVISIVEEHQKEKSRTHTIAFLLTMIFWFMNLKQI